ncbi:MAG: 30S ribosomal protein S6 [Patescibacteria group bacterium]
MKTENQEIKKRKYEIAFVLNIENASVISQALSNGKFTVLTENPLEKIQLAYSIKKENYAYFGYFHFEGEPAAVKNLRIDLKLNPNVLRYVIITPPFVKKPAWKKPESAPTSQEARFASPAEKQTMPVGKQTSPVESILTNEALEKKIEEILK